MKALVLTAGLATRFRPQSEILPKPAIPFLEVPLFLYGVELLKHFGVTDFIFNLHHLPQVMQKTVEDYKEHMQSVTFVPEKPKILGSAGAIYNARTYLEKEENFFLCNGDEIILPSNQESLKNFVSLHKERKSLATLFCMKHPEAGKKFGAIWVDDSMRVRHIGKTCDNKNLSPYHFTGIQILNKKIFESLHDGESNIFYDHLLPAIQKGQRVQVFIDSCEWAETGSNADYIEATKYFLENFFCLKIQFFIQVDAKVYAN